YIIVEENDLGLVNFPTLEIAGELRKNGKIDEADECRIQEAILKPSYDMPTVGFVISAKSIAMGALMVASIFCEPVDWGMTFYSWTQGNFSYYDLLNFLPFVSGQAARAIGNGLEAGIDALRWGNRAENAGDIFKGMNNLDISDDTLKWLNKGDTDNVVYYGIKNGEEVYTGITRQELAKRLYQHNYSGKNLDDLVEQVSGLTRSQARSIEQYLIENGTANALNRINSISPSHRYYDEAMQWAKEFINNLD
ncbi:MAG: hypothetical protein KAX49_18195, partial [Halanaerobiales bacterium]|nr:hypothetical protein [Halanaerobiales bacterium]